MAFIQTKQWEYKILSVHKNNVIDGEVHHDITWHGEKGWELISTYSDETLAHVYFFFKREKQ